MSVGVTVGSVWKHTDKNNEVTVWRINGFSPADPNDNKTDMTLELLALCHGQNSSLQVGDTTTYWQDSFKYSAWTPIEEADIPLLLLGAL